MEQSILILIFAFLTGMGYYHLIRRYIRYFTRTRKGKVKATARSYIGITYLLILIWILTRTIRALHTAYFMPWCILLALEAIYVAQLIACSQTVYICEDCILYPGSSSNAAGYSYRIQGNTLELVPDKPPQKPEIYRIEDGETELRGILQHYRSFG